MTITEFILARVDEDEEAWRPVATAPRQYGKIHARRHLAHCKAIRRIVELHAVHSEIEHFGIRKGATIYWCNECDHDRDYGHIGSERAGCDTLHTLASIWSDHPDYRQEWAA